MRRVDERGSECLDLGAGEIVDGSGSKAEIYGLVLYVSKLSRGKTISGVESFRFGAQI